MSNATPFEPLAPPPADTIAGTFHRLLKQPGEIVTDAEAGGFALAARMFAGSIVCYALYGLAVGLFGGGWQIVVAILKVPIIIFATLFLCAPSFYVFSVLAGSRFSLRGSLTLLLGFAGTIALLFLGFMPVAWLFSVSTRSAIFVVWMQVLLWVITTVFARRFLAMPFDDSALRRTVFFWWVLFVLVSFQMTTHLRPVLWEPGQSFVEQPGISFLEHLGSVGKPVR